MKKKIIVRCPCLTVSGYGQHSLFVLRSLRKYEEFVDLYITAISWGQTSWSHIDNEERNWIDATLQKTIQYMQNGGKFDIAVHVTIANELQNLAPVNILVTAGVEVDKIAPIWVEKIEQLANKIVVPSEYPKQCILSTSYRAQNTTTGEVLNNFKVSKPVVEIGYPAVEIKAIENYDQLKLETEFNFLVQSQWGPRKNIENTIAWFVEEFYDQEDVGLVLKLSLRNNCIMDRMACTAKVNQILAKYPQRKCKVYLVHGYMTEEEKSLLYTHPKIQAFVSISHGESWGLGMYEAVCAGLPVITVNHGGQKDFLYGPTNSKKDAEIKPLFAEVEYDVAPIGKESVWDGVLQEGTSWAYAKQGSFKMKLREVKREYPRFKQQAKRLQRYVLEKFDPEKQYKTMAETILGEQLKTISIDDLPKVSIFTSVFNGGKYIEEYMKDVVRQTIFNKIELILVHPKDSLDFEKEYKIIQTYLDKYSNIVYHQIEKDTGTLYHCWNIGVRLATGEYVGNRNLDDRMKKDQLERCAKQLYQNLDIDGVYFDFWITEKANETFENNSSNGKRYNFSEFSYQTMKMMNLVHAAPIYRKVLHDKFGYYDEKYRSAADWEYFLRVSQKGIQFKKIQDVLGLYYFNPIGVSTNKENFSWKRQEEKEIYNKYKLLEIER